jgi:hypothetical protein
MSKPPKLMPDGPGMQDTNADDDDAPVNDAGGAVNHAENAHAGTSDDTSDDDGGHDDLAHDGPVHVADVLQPVNRAETALAGMRRRRMEQALSFQQRLNDSENMADMVLMGYNNEGEAVFISLASVGHWIDGSYPLGIQQRCAACRALGRSMGHYLTLFTFPELLNHISMRHAEVTLSQYFDCIKSMSRLGALMHNA